MAERHLQTPIMHRAVHHAGLVFIGGTACDDETLDMAGQAREVFAKLDRYLAEAGSDKTRMLSVTLYLTDLAQKPAMDAIWKEWLPASALPARVCIAVSDLGGDARLEASVIAHR
jgi:enamine deaminase RidA (YjgF/YER057c/UK114 family)